MSSNCLVTKLKGIVDNDMLETMTSMKIKFEKDASFVVTPYEPSRPITVRSVNNDSIPLRTITNVSLDQQYIAVTSGTIIEISPKNRIGGLGGGLPVDFSKIKYAITRNVSLAASGAFGDISDLANGVTKFGVLNIRTNQGIFGDISSLVGKLITVEGEINLSDTNVSGNMSVFVGDSIKSGSIINIAGSLVKLSQNTLDALANQNVKVLYLPKQLIDE